MAGVMDLSNLQVEGSVVKYVKRKQFNETNRILVIFKSLKRKQFLKMCPCYFFIPEIDSA